MDSALVYNLVIDDYHTYLVGSSLRELSFWRKNMDFPDDGGNAAGEAANNLVQPAVRATFFGGGQRFTDVNPIARAVTQEAETIPGLRAPNADRTTMHAEIGVMVRPRTRESGVALGYWKSRGSMSVLLIAEASSRPWHAQFVSKSLVVKDADGTIYNFPAPQSLQPIKSGGQGWRGSGQGWRGS